MGNTRPHDKDNPAVFTSPLEHKDGFDNGGGTFMSLPNDLLPVIPHVESTQQEIPQADFMMRNSLPNPRMAAISTNISSNHLRTCSISDVPAPEVNVRGHYSNQDLMFMAHNARNRADFSSTQSQPSNRNFMLSGNAAGGYQMVRQAGEARISNVNRPQTNGCRSNLTISKPKYSTQDIANKLEEAAPSSHVQQTARTFSNLGHNMDAGIPSFQTNAGGFLNPGRNANGQTLSRNDIEVIGSANVGAGSNPFQVLHRPQYSMQQYMPTPGGRNLSSVSNRNVGYSKFDDRTLQNNQPGPSGSLGGNLARFHNYRQADLPGPVSETANPTLIPSWRPLDMHSLYDLSSQRPAESAMNSSSLTLSGSSTRSNRAGSSITVLEYGGSQVAQNNGIPQIVRAQSSAAGGSLFSQRTGVPKRLGVEVNANGISQVAERDPLSSGGVGLQTTGKKYQTSNTRSNLLPNNLRATPPIGLSKGATRNQYPTNLRGPSFVTGRSQDVPVQSKKGPPGFASTNETTGQVSPVATAHRRPILKRSAMWSPPAPRWVQRQKIGASTVVHPSKPNPTVAVPPINKTVPTVSSIKWEGGDGRPKRTGEKCYICKRDLSFTREGAIYQPGIRAAVAVLPCGHTFHDECLQEITPEDQSKEPPCIPCAVNEN